MNDVVIGFPVTGWNCTTPVADWSPVPAMTSWSTLSGGGDVLAGPPAGSLHTPIMFVLFQVPENETMEFGNATNVEHSEMTELGEEGVTAPFEMRMSACTD